MKRSVAILIVGVLALVARAQTSEPVFVAFRFEVPKVVNGFEPEKRVEAEKKVSEALAKLCEQKRWWWTFKPATDETQYPRLEVWLEEGVDWQIGVAFAADGQSPVTASWSGLLFKPADFEQLAPTLKAEGWAPTIARQFEREILRRQGAALLARLQLEAPLGRVVKLPDGSAATGQAPVVLPLAWERYKVLSASLFTIRCRSSEGPVMLHSAGMETAGRFTPQQPPFDGLVVRLSEWQEPTGPLVPIEQRLDKLPLLQPVAFFLKEHRKAWAVAP